MKDVGWLLSGGGVVLGSVRVVRRVGGRERAEGPGGKRIVIFMLEEGGGGIGEVEGMLECVLSGILRGGVSIVSVRGATLSILYR